MAEAREDILRIGVIRAGKIIEEKLVRKRAAVSVGAGTRNTIILPGVDAPKSFELFEMRGSDYYLAFTDKMTGRISVGDKAADLQALKGQGQVRKSGSTYYIKLGAASRGRVGIGDFILLFQFVKPPPEPVRPQLPQIVRGYWVHNIDWPYTSTFGITMACMLTIWIWAGNTVPAGEMTMKDIPDRFARMIMPDKEIAKPQEKDNGTGGEGVEKPKKKIKKKKETKEAGDGAGNSKEAKAASAAVRRAKMEKKVSGRGLLKVLGVRGTGGVSAGGAVADVFGDGSVEGSGNGAFDGVGGLDIATAAGQQGQRGMGGAAAASIGDLNTRGVVGAAGSGGRTKSEARVVARVTSAALEDFDSDSRSQQDIVKKIRQRIGGIKHCYEKRLKRDPDLKGKIVIRFVIHPGGKVISVEIVENTTGDSELAACIAARFRAIRFPSAEGSETSVTYPFILAPGG
ncbi:MAG TPA: AgmX/PglI C-terminal domain-containing protein [Myxococcota bacterium]|nr:AgmX/PglI C-terminal domain-containing protein [Myxococcota bacterium]